MKRDFGARRVLPDSEIFATNVVESLELVRASMVIDPIHLGIRPDPASFLCSSDGGDLMKASFFFLLWEPLKVRPLFRLKSSCPGFEQRFLCASPEVSDAELAE
jgi:hypothetical protein